MAEVFVAGWAPGEAWFGSGQCVKALTRTLSPNPSDHVNYLYRVFITSFCMMAAESILWGFIGPKIRPNHGEHRKVSNTTPSKPRKTECNIFTQDG